MKNGAVQLTMQPVAHMVFLGTTILYYGMKPLSVTI